MIVMSTWMWSIIQSRHFDSEQNLVPRYSGHYVNYYWPEISASQSNCLERNSVDLGQALENNGCFLSCHHFEAAMLATVDAG
jgi:hypothetical protein